MITSLRFIEDWRCFKKDQVVPFRPGINLLVGNQGSGKSSLIQAIQAAGTSKNTIGTDFHCAAGKAVITATESCTTFAFDFERDNYRTKGYFDGDTTFHIKAMFVSHGEQNIAILKTLHQLSDVVIILDEPDMALSIQSIVQLAEILKDAAGRGCQIIAAIHNPLLIELAGKNVYSMGHQKWISGQEFINEAKKRCCLDNSGSAHGN